MRKRSEAIKKASEELKEELSKPYDPETGEVFEVTPAQRASPEELAMQPAFERIVERLYSRKDDPVVVFDRLERGLRVKVMEERGSFAHALEAVQGEARDAHWLWQIAQLERNRWELDNAVSHGAMRSKAMRVLQQEKDAGVRSKQITEADIHSMCAIIFPDEYKASELRKKQVEMLEESTKDLARRWSERAEDLRVLYGKMR